MFHFFCTLLPFDATSIAGRLADKQMPNAYIFLYLFYPLYIIVLLDNINANRDIYMIQKYGCFCMYIFLHYCNLLTGF